MRTKNNNHQQKKKKTSQRNYKRKVSMNFSCWNYLKKNEFFHINIEILQNEKNNKILKRTFIE